MLSGCKSILDQGASRTVELREQGVTPLLHYDPLGRVIRTDLPDTTYSQVDFSPWEQTSHDPNDTAGNTTWHTDRMALPAGDPDRRAAELTVAHHDTPTLTRTDHLGRPVRVIAHNKDSVGADVFSETRSVLDIEGNVLQVIDARGNTAQTTEYGMAGQALKTNSVDAGERRMLTDTVGNPLRAFDSRGFVRRFEYDALLCPTHQWVTPPAATEFLTVRTLYGEDVTAPETLNLRGVAYRTYDGAGVSTNDSFDFKGNPLSATRQLATTYTTTVDWTVLATRTTVAGAATAASSSLLTETFTLSTTYDALDRPLTQTKPDTTQVDLAYNEAGLLETVDAFVRGAATATAFVTAVDYDVHGRRARIDYGKTIFTT